MTIRELKKDTVVLQMEKQRIRAQRISKNQKSQFRGGNAPTDESWVVAAKGKRGGKKW